MQVITALNELNLPYSHIWYYINDKTQRKEPCFEKNNKTLQEILQDKNKKFTQPKNKYNRVTKMREPFSESETATLTRAVSIYLKHTPDLYCIDVDDKSIASLDEFIDKTGHDIFRNCLWIPGNTKGIHIYVWVKDMIPYTNQQDVYKKFKGDFIKTNNMWEKEGKEFQNFDKATNCIPVAYDDIKQIFQLAKLKSKQKSGYFTNPVSPVQQSEDANRPIKLEQLDSAYDTSKIISESLFECLKYCKDSWYVLQKKTQLWKQQKEPLEIILTEIRKYINKTNLVIANEIAASTSDKDQDKLVKEQKEYLNYRKKCENSGYLAALVKCLKSDLLDATFDEKLDENIGKLAFTNGIMDLETKIFREGIFASDYLTDTIQYPYEPCADTSFVRSKLKQVMNNNEGHLAYWLALVSTALIGQPQLFKAICFMIDKTGSAVGDNGKTIFFDILQTLMPCYVYNAKVSFIEKNNTKVHKQVVMTKGKRLVYLEELPKKNNLNIEWMKEFSGGTQVENEIMYGTSEKVRIRFVMFVLTNHLPVIPAEEQALYNRFKQISHNSHFDRTGKRTENDEANLKFIADPELATTIKTQHYQEVFQLIIDNAHLFYQNGKKLPEIPEQFVKDAKETKEKNDEFGVWFEEFCELQDGEKVSLQLLIEKCNLHKYENMKKKIIKEGMERKGFKYMKDLSGMGCNNYGKFYKGGYVGCRLVEEKTGTHPEKAPEGFEE
ncbi:MAG: hypothetical protein EB127_02325 [Alphaproteobacteria bacterium]|nr:hypothetical protein [Alphaproteobacteria bacterium]